MAGQAPATVTTGDLKRYRGFRQDEGDAAHLYRAMAASEDRAEVAELYLRLADAEDRHAAFWEQQLQQGDASVPPRRPTWRARALASIERPRKTLP